MQFHLVDSDAVLVNHAAHMTNKTYKQVMNKVNNIYLIFNTNLYFRNLNERKKYIFVNIWKLKTDLLENDTITYYVMKFCKTLQDKIIQIRSLVLNALHFTIIQSSRI